MSAYDWNLSAGAPLCVFSDSYYWTGRKAIFQRLTIDTTAEQFQAALESLQRLRDELVKDMPAMHYGALVGTHRCVNHLFREASARLRSLQILQPAPLPQPPEPPPPEPQAHSLEDVVANFETTPEAFLGETEAGAEQG
jgi:hypothetical protein